MSFKIKKAAFILSVLIVIFGTAAFSFVKPVSTDRIKTYVNVIKTNNVKYSSISTFSSISTTEKMSDEDVEKDITDLIIRYYDAKQKVDMESVKELVSDIDDVQESKLQTEAQYIEKYENIKCYILNAKEEGAYRVYVECDIKGYKVDTLMPALYALYVKKNDEGKHVIYLGSFSRKEQKDIVELDDTPVVKKLKKKVSDNLEKIISTDKEVKEFYEMINEADNKDSKDSKAEKSTEKPKETDSDKETASNEPEETDKDKESDEPKETEEAKETKK